MAAGLPKSALKNVTTAGTRVPLFASSTQASHFSIRARPGNTGIVYVGDVTVASSNGYQLDKGQELKLEDLRIARAIDCIDLSNIYIDSATNGDGVTVFYISKE